MQRSSQSWFNGVPAESLPIDDRAVQFGDACFTTIAVYGGKLEFLPEHLNRLQMTAARLRFDAIDWSLLEQEILRAASAVERAVLRVALSRGQSRSGYASPEKLCPNRILSLRSFPENVEWMRRDGITVRLCETRLSQNSLLAGLKHGNRLEQVLARAEWQDPAIGEGLMLDTDGYLIEGTCSNVFFVDAQGCLCTPALHSSGVDGIIRQRILAEAELSGMPTRIEDYSPDILSQASEVLVCNCVLGIVSVLACGDLRWPPGAITRRLQQIIFNAQGGS